VLLQDFFRQDIEKLDTLQPSHKSMRLWSNIGDYLDNVASELLLLYPSLKKNPTNCLRLLKIKLENYETGQQGCHPSKR
jgi:hypothetical protein